MQQVFRIGITNHACRMTALSTRTIGATNAGFKNAVIDRSGKQQTPQSRISVPRGSNHHTANAQRTRSQALTLCQNRAYSRCSTACS
jgi:hypothetical protein